VGIVNSEMVLVYHLPTLGNYVDVVRSQVAVLTPHIALFSKIIVCVSGNVGEGHVRSLWGGLEIEIVDNESGVSLFEYPTLRYLHELSSHLENSHIMYLHAKCSTYEEGFKDCMCYRVNIENWTYGSLAEFIRSGKKVCGHRLVLSGEGLNYLSQNIWIAKSSYLRTLDDPMSLPIWNRYHAERWILSGDIEEEDIYL
jgi:hypothetical protein